MAQLVRSIRPVVDARDQLVAQRNIGFEFEHPNIHLRRVPGSATELAAKTARGLLSPDEWPNTAPAPLACKEQVHQFDHGATVEADDTLGVGNEDIEIVAPGRDPYKHGYPISAEGLDALGQTVVNAADFAQDAAKLGQEAISKADAGFAAATERWEQENSLVALLENKNLHQRAAETKKSELKSLKSDLKDAKREKEKREKEEEKRRKGEQKAKKEKAVKLGGGEIGERKEPLASSPTSFATMASKLGNIRYNLATAGLINPQPRRDQCHVLIPMSSIVNYGRDDIILENASAAGTGWAIQVTAGIPLRNLSTELKGSAPGGEYTEEVLGFLADQRIPRGPMLEGLVRFLASYIGGAIRWELDERSKNFKQLATLMARTDCASMFAQLPPASRDPIAKNPGLWVAAWTAAVGEEYVNAPFYRKRINKKWEGPWYSRGFWLESMVGRWDEQGHVRGVDLVANDPEMGSMGKLKDKFDPGMGEPRIYGKPLPIFEYRQLASWPPSEWVSKSLDFFFRVRQNMKP